MTDHSHDVAGHSHHLAGHPHDVEVPDLWDGRGLFGASDPDRLGRHVRSRWLDRDGIVAGLICAVAMVVAGGLQGLLWALTAPRINVTAALAGSESVFGAQGGVDVYFGLICVVGGLIGGTLAYLRARDAGWPVPVGLALGGFAGSVLAGWVGHWCRSGRVLSKLPSGSSPLASQLVDFRLRSHGLYLIMPATAVAALAIALWFATRFARR